MALPPASVGAITMFVDDRRRSRAFYENVFGLAPVHEDDDAVAFKFETRSSTCSRPVPRPS
jgi:catechol 2,3-dioxygenase-like lactoylglutathione lyase family enzyme